MLWRVVFGIAMMCAGAGAAYAQFDPFPGIERPLYPEVIVPTDDSYSRDTGLSAFRQAIDKASEARVKLPDGGQAYDPEAMLPLLADEVELFIGQGERAYHEDFVFIGRQPAREALEIVGRLSRGSDSADPVVQRRYGMHVLDRLALEPTVGRSPWLDGRICTASYGKLEWPAWSSLWEKLKMFDKRDWLIATVVHPDFEEVAPPDWPKRYQMVPVSPQQKRSAGSIGIVAPEGGSIFFTAERGLFRALPQRPSLLRDAERRVEDHRRRDAA
jgi:hypothetical protein